MVRPILEYASPALNPHLKDVQLLEQVQRRAARFECNNYRDRTQGRVDNMLAQLKWDSLEKRRKIKFKIKTRSTGNGLVDMNKSLYIQPSDPRNQRLPALPPGKGSPSSPTFQPNAHLSLELGLAAS